MTTAIRLTRSSNEYVKMGASSAVISHNAAYTVMAWVYFPALWAGNNRVIVLTNSDGAWTDEDALLVNSSGAWSTFAYVFGGGSTVTGSSPSTSTWYHVALVRTSTSNAYVYVNGVLDITNTANISGRGWDSSRQFGLGTYLNNPTNNSADVRIRHCKAWTRALAAAEVLSEMRQGAPTDATSLYGYWPFHAGAGRSDDWSGRGQHFTETNTPTDEAGNNVPLLASGGVLLAVPAPAVAVGGVTGTSAITLPIPTAATSGTASRTATSAWTLPLPTSAATGKQTYNSTSAISLPLPTMAATGQRYETATGTILLPIPTMSSSGKQTLNSTSAITLPLPTSASTGVASHLGTSAWTLPLPTMAASGSVGALPTATSAFTLPMPTVSASGLQTLNASSAWALPLPTIASTGVASHLGTSAWPLPMPTMAASGTLGAAQPTATSAFTLPLPVSAATGKLTYIGTSAWLLPVPTSTASGAAGAMPAATAAFVLPLPISAAVGTAPPTTAGVVTVGSWSPQVAFLAGEEYRITVTGPSATNPRAGIVVNWVLT